jgi:hypothetical protein
VIHKLEKCQRRFITVCLSNAAEYLEIYIGKKPSYLPRITSMMKMIGMFNIVPFIS